MIIIKREEEEAKKAAEKLEKEKEATLKRRQSELKSQKKDSKVSFKMQNSSDEDEIEKKDSPKPKKKETTKKRRESLFKKEQDKKDKDKDQMKKEKERVKKDKEDNEEKKDEPEPEKKIIQPRKKKSEITNELTQDDKKAIFNAIIKDQLFDYKKRMEEKDVSVLEDLSSKDSKWTSVHFALYHGIVDIIRYCLDKLKEDEIFDESMKLKNKEGYSPVMCLLRSKILDFERKKTIMTKLLELYNYNPSKQEKKEMAKDIEPNMKDLIEKFNLKLE